jgi:hypothetical protein
MIKWPRLGSINYRNKIKYSRDMNPGHPTSEIFKKWTTNCPIVYQLSPKTGQISLDFEWQVF